MVHPELIILVFDFIELADFINIGYDVLSGIFKKVQNSKFKYISPILF